jgi:Ethanolamine utilization protein EutJ (predicted chaperonin)
MKKVSSAATKQRRNISQQKLTIGFDLGDGDIWYWVVDEAGQIRLERAKRIAVKSADGSMATAATRRENKTLFHETGEEST